MRRLSNALVPLLVVAGLALGCAATREPRTAVAESPPVPAPRDANREARALLLLLADQRRFEPVALEALLDANPAIREALAVATGRIGDARGRGVLQGLLVDAGPPVRRAAAFALGEIGTPETHPALLRAAVDDDAETGALAVEALGKAKAPLADVRRVLTALTPEESDRRLAPSLFRFAGDGLVEAASRLLESALPEVRFGAAYSLGRVAPPAGADLLRGLLGDGDPRVRAAAARGLGETGGPEDLTRLEPLLGDPEPSPKIQGLRAGATILVRSSAIAPIGWGERLAALARDPAPGVRATAIESSAPFLEQPAVRAAVLAAAAAGEPRERELALLALARSGGEDAVELVRRASIDADRFVRARAVEAAAALGLADIVETGAADPEAAVRVAAATARLEAAGDEVPAELVRALLADPDFAVRTTALESLVERPVLAGAEILRVIGAAASDRSNDARLAAVRALAARGGAPGVVPSEQAEIAVALQRLLEDRDYLVRREAVTALDALGVAHPPLGPVETGMNGPTYELVLAQTAAPRFVALESERGRMIARLDCPEAPLTCLSFLKLAAQGYFDGTRFHRVVPDFVVQGGDPRGDGWGGPGYAIRDEINRLRYTRGAVGMALSGPDTGGSQFFVTLAPQPHLDGGYTVFGRIVDGLEILDRIRQGDTLQRVKEVEWNE